MWNLAWGYLYFCLQRFYSKSSWWKYLQQRHNNVFNMQIILIAFLTLSASQWNTIYFTSDTWKNMITFVILLFLTDVQQCVHLWRTSLYEQFLSIVCMMSASLYFWFIPLVLTHSLFCPPSRFSKRYCCGDVLPGVLAPSAIGCTGLHGSWTPSGPLRLDLTSYENKTDLLPLNSAVTFARTNSKCLLLCSGNTCSTVRNLSLHFPLCSPKSLPSGHTPPVCFFPSSWEQSFPSSFRSRAGQMTVLSSELKNLSSWIEKIIKSE